MSSSTTPSRRLAARLCACAMGLGGSTTGAVAFAQAPPPAPQGGPSDLVARQPGAATPAAPSPTPPAPDHWFQATYPSLHFRLGKAWRVGDDTRDTGFAFDATVGAPSQLRGASSGFWPEIGYRYSGVSSHGSFLQAGLGLWAMPTEVFVVRYSPAFLIGKQAGTAVGFRHGLSFSLLEALGLELSHAYISDSDRHHEVGLLVVTDLAFGIGFLARTAHGRPLVVNGAPTIARLVSRSDWA